MNNSKHKIIFDGTIIDADQAVATAQSRGLMYGDGCFETLRCYAGSFLHLQEHLDRFKSAAHYLGIAVPDFFEAQTFLRHIKKLLSENKLYEKDAVLRFQLWRDGGRGYDIKTNGASHFSVLTSALPNISGTISLDFVDTRRIPNVALPSGYKFTNNINYIMAAKEADGKGADDALMQTTEGYLSETTIANIFWISRGVVYTPSRACDLLPGITRNLLIKLCRQELNLDVEEGMFMPDSLQHAEAVWVCNSVREMVMVSRVGHTNFETHHAVTERLKAEFESYKKQHLCG